MPVCAWACLNHLSIYKARVLHQVESFPYKHRHCNWSHVPQMREFQALLDFSGTMSCGFGLDGSSMTHYCCCRRRGDDDKGSALA